MVNMTTTAVDTVHADLMSLFNNCLRRHRRNALADIFESLSEDERVALLDRLYSANTTSSDYEENGELSSVFNATDHSILCDPDDHRDIDILNDIQENSEENDRLSGLSEEESCVSFNNLETARPSCLVGLKPASSTPSSSSSFTSTSSMSPSQQTPPSSNCSSASSSPSSSSSEDEGTTPSCSSESSTFNNHGCTTSTTSPARSSSSSSSMIRCNISFSRVRRNALHDLLETLTQDDIEKLKNLYQSTLYSLKPFSEQAQSPIRGLHECKA